MQQEDTGGKLIELSARLDAHRRKKRRTVLWIVLVVVFAAMLFFVLYYRESYSNYKVLDKYTRGDGGSGSYTELNGTLIRYSADGVTGMDKAGNELWSEAYEMQTQIVSSCGDSFAISEKEGNHIYVFSSEGKTGEITTTYPIQSISVSSQGITVAIMHEGQQSMIYCYDREGNILVESKASLSDTGFPLSCAISEDGTRLLVSYVKIGDCVTSKIVCYRFGEKDKKSGDYTILEETYDDLLISMVYFVGNYTCAAVGDGKVLFYSGSEKMTLEKELSFEEEIVSVAHDSENFALVLQEKSESGVSHYGLTLLDKDGNKKMSAEYEGEFTSVDLRDGQIILLNDTKCAIYTDSGRKIFDGEFSESVAEVFPLGGLNRYFIVTKDSMETIRLVK